MPARRREAQAPSDPLEAIGCFDAVPIGSGGSSLVYRARQRAFDRLIALKVLSVPFADERARRRFERELALAGRLTGHPNVVTVFASGFLGDGRAYVEMEYCPGGSLADRLASGGALPVRDVVSIGVKMAGVLELAGRAGIIHRDVKPANVLVTRFGEPALADFGIATVAGEMTATTQALTPVHAAPEVLESRPVGPGADQWSLGSTLHTLLAGRAPFASEEDEGLLAGMLRILNDPVPAIPRADVPETLRSVLGRAMSKEPAQRWPGPVALGQALQEVERREGWAVTTLPTSEEVAEARYRDSGDSGEPGGPGGSGSGGVGAGRLGRPPAEPGGWGGPAGPGGHQQGPAGGPGVDPRATYVVPSEVAGLPSPPADGPSPLSPLGPAEGPMSPGPAAGAAEQTQTWARRAPAGEETPGAGRAGPRGQQQAPGPPGAAGMAGGTPASPVPPEWAGFAGAASLVSSAPSPPGDSPPPGGAAPSVGGLPSEFAGPAAISHEPTQYWARPRSPAAPGIAAQEDKGPRNRLWVAIGAAAAVVVALIVVIVVINRSSSGPRVTTRTIEPPAHPTPNRYAPVNLTVIKDQGTSVTLRWQDPSNGLYPFVVDVLGAHVQPATGQTRTVVAPLDPTKGYCFTVGAVYGTASLPAYAPPVCVRGAHPVSTTTMPAAGPAAGSGSATGRPGG